MALSNRAKLGIAIAVAVVAGLEFVWLALLLLLLAVFLIAWDKHLNLPSHLLRACQAAKPSSGHWKNGYSRKDSIPCLRRRRLRQTSASKIPIWRSMFEMDQLMSALFLLALL